LGLERSSVRLDHLGVVAIVCKKLGLQQLIDDHLGPIADKQIISPGQASLAILFNMLAINQQPLYLTPAHIQRLPFQRILFDAEVQPQQFNDDTLGRTLDRLYSGGLEELFLKLAARARANFSHAEGSFLHCDTSRLLVWGDYTSNIWKQSQYVHDDEPQLIEIVKGYNKRHRGDFKQFVLSLISSDRLPVFLSTASGNAHDSSTFKQIIQDYSAQVLAMFEEEKTLVFDSAFYDQEIIGEIGYSFAWISRVPERIASARELLEESPADKFEKITGPLADKLKGYSTFECTQDYGGVKQHWVVVYSKAAYEAELKKFESKLEKIEEELTKQLWHLGNRGFASRSELEQQLETVAKKWKYHQIKDIQIEVRLKKASAGRGRPKRGEAMKEVFHASVSFQRDEDEISRATSTKGRFIVASNRVFSDTEALGRDSLLQLSQDRLLEAYKEQASVERGFRFLKDPLFLADRFFLHKKKRIMALSMLLGVSLLIYSLCELEIRQAFYQTNFKFHDGYGKKTTSPTARRVFRYFEGVDVWYLKYGDQLFDESVVNLSELHKQVLNVLGDEYVKMYQDGIQRLDDLVEKNINDDVIN
jgi:transposase